jgi:hypothetical protein
MANKLSSFQKGKIIFDIIESLSNIENKDIIFIPSESHPIIIKIAKKSGIPILDRWEIEGNTIDISEDISLTFEDREFQLLRKLNNISCSKHFRPNIEFEVSEDLKKLTEEFERENIPTSGPCETLIGEIFRAIQRIQYRAYNDGDVPWDVTSPTFMSYIFMKHQIDMLNYSSYSYKKTGQHEFEFTDEFLKERCWDGKISDFVETQLCNELDFTKYQLIDLLSNGKIEDSKNRFDSRDYTLKKQDWEY